MNKTELTKLIEAVNILQNECLVKKDEKMKIIKYENKTIKPRANGSGYYTRYRDYNGQHSIYGKTAEEVLEKLKTALKNVPERKTTSKGITLKEWWFKWLEIYKQDVRSTTMTTYKTIYNNYIKKIESMSLNDFTVFNTSEFINSIQFERQKVRTYNYLNACFDKAVLLKLMKENPCKLFPRPKHKKINIRPLTVDEQDIFVKSIKGCIYEPLYLTMLQLGLRVGEALALTREDLDFNQRLVRINKTYYHGTVGEPKTDCGNRFVPMIGTTYNILQQFIDLNPTERIFKNDVKCVSKKLKEICEKNGIVGISTHSLRKTFATRLYELGVPPMQLQQWLGHADVLTTERIYIKLVPNSNKKWLNIANNILTFDTQKDTQMAI